MASTAAGGIDYIDREDDVIVYYSSRQDAIDGWKQYWGSECCDPIPEPRQSKKEGHVGQWYMSYTK